MVELVTFVICNAHLYLWLYIFSETDKKHFFFLDVEIGSLTVIRNGSDLGKKKMQNAPKLQRGFSLDQ